MKKLHLLKRMLLLFALIVGSNSLWAQTTVSMTSFDDISGYVDGDDNVSYIAEKGSAGTAPGVYDNEIRVYQNGGTFTITANNGCKIQSVTLGSSMATTVKYSIDGGTDSDNKSITAGGTTTVSGLNCSSLKFTCTGTSKSSRLYVNSLSVTYSGGSSVAKPTFSLEGGAVEKGTTVELTPSTDGATIYYIQGENPGDPTSSSTQYTGAITINEATTIKAVAIKNAESSVVATAEYTIKKVEDPTFTIDSGTAVIAGTPVELTTTTEGATIYYTMGDDPEDPTSSSTEYTGAITINEATTIKAIAIKDNWDNSEVTSATYTLIVPIPGLSIDFEASDLAQYTDWEFDKIAIRSNKAITPHGDNNYGINANSSSASQGTETASITTKTKIAHPGTFTCYVSKESNNTTASTWYVKVSENGSDWDDAGTKDAKSMSKGVWQEFSVDLSSYSNVYVRLYYSGSSAIRAIDDIVLTERVILNAKGYATYSSANDFTFSGEGVKAYKMALDEGEKSILGTEVTGKIKAGEGILFRGDASAKVTITPTTGATALDGNDLKGSTASDGTTADKPTYCYVLSGDTFVSYTGAALVPNKAYFEASTDLSADARAFTITFEDSETTSVADVRGKMADVRGEYFDLQGRKVAQPTKGLYIVNGKKVIVR